MYPLSVAMRSLGIEKFFITLLHVFPCNSKDELEAEEYRILEAYIAAGRPTYNARRAGNKHAEESKIKNSQTKKAQGLKGTKSAVFSFGHLGFYQGPRNTSYWRFKHRKEGSEVLRSWSCLKYGYWQAKGLAEAERKRIYPEWKNDEELELESLFRIDV